MVEACAGRGYEYVAITDHTKAVRVAGGLDAAEFRRQRRAIEALRSEFPRMAILHGAEVDILADGTLDECHAGKGRASARPAPRRRRAGRRTEGHRTGGERRDRPGSVSDLVVEGARAHPAGVAHERAHRVRVERGDHPPDGVDHGRPRLVARADQTPASLAASAYCADDGNGYVAVSARESAKGRRSTPPCA